ncbi:hypothetical protein MWU75_07065 [Ornithinimicrobium sp. F0845]|uniref:hypothetical protein n=1 Tax=Ornithinimicrobium sp. F0845 TaxID=2926412 RepID=UPI001FF3889A|nr:hypothetical protein [Ornithinimicrobium sp. F0845]MCK0111894.1 hypothetical protein [Ornithinimicrobium sp. F0845]
MSRPRPSTHWKLQEGRAGEGVAVPVYEFDGETVIGEFVVGGGEPALLDDSATVT